VVNVLQQEFMQQLADGYGLFEVQAMACVLKHDDIFVGDGGEHVVVEPSVVEDFALERLRAVQHEALAVKGVIHGGETVDVLLV